MSFINFCYIILKWILYHFNTKILVLQGKILIDIFLEFRLNYSATALKMVNYPSRVWILDTKSLLIENVNLLLLSKGAKTEIFPEIIFQNYFILGVTVIKEIDLTQVTWVNTVMFIPNWYYTGCSRCATPKLYKKVLYIGESGLKSANESKT